MDLQGVLGHRTKSRCVVVVEASVKSWWHRYTDGPDAEAHICSFLNTWQTNHSTQRLTAGEINASKISKFTLSLDGPAARWYSRHNPREFATFQDVRTQFLELFHREIPIHKLLRQLYTIEQGPHGTVAQFVLCFQDLYRQMARDILANHLKDTFLVGLREPLRTTLALTDFSQNTIEQVVACILALARIHNSSSFAMGTL